jgi:Domain of unknown function (DUF6456)
MFHSTVSTEIQTAKVPQNATFLWRTGRWHVQLSGKSAFKQLSQRNSRVLEQLKRAGRLEENAPGLYCLGGGLAMPVFDSAESPLQRLGLMKQTDGTTVLDAEQLRAGERLRVDYERAHLSPRVTMSYEMQGSSGGRQAQFSDNHIEKLNDVALEARDKVHQALAAVGPELSGILLHVCCMAGGLEQAELRLNLPRRAGKAVLQLALTRLARHYGYKVSLHHDGPSKIGHWAVGDFKPGIMV